MKTVAQRPQSLTTAKFHYCPGCTHGIIHRLVAEVVRHGADGVIVGSAIV
ncbi:MAG TPA: 2-oxoglutarate oxidoreductase, partial [Syntrophomonas sp.]|nr:2-oxoglutarate oxidoreductase [Syntrophomonas sp.]